MRQFTLQMIFLKSGALSALQPEIVANQSYMKILDPLHERRVLIVFKKCFHNVVVFYNPIHFDIRQFMLGFFKLDYLHCAIMTEQHKIRSFARFLKLG